jgi:hypothetical protein
MTQEETRALMEHIVRLYCERYTCRQIAELIGMDYEYVRDALIERGITPRQRVLRAQCKRAGAARLVPITAFWLYSAAKAMLAVAA